MKAPLKSKAKYLLLIPIIIFLFSVLYYIYASEKITDTIFEEKHKEIFDQVVMLKTGIDATDDRYWEDYEPNIIASADFINSASDVYAWVYKRVNGGWEMVYDGQGPREFLLAMTNFLNDFDGREKGSIDIDQELEDGSIKFVHLCFSQMPLYTSQEERYIVFTGLSKLSLVSSVPAWVDVGQWASMVITLWLNLLLIIWIVQARRR